MKVKDFMAKSPACCTPDTSLYEAARLMIEHDCGAIPVVSSPEALHVVGIVTDRDIACRIIGKGADAQRATVEECMSTPVQTVRPDDTLDTCIRAMEQFHVRRLPVTEDGGVCCGMVSLADIADWATNAESAALLRAVSHGPRTPSRAAIPDAVAASV